MRYSSLIRRCKESGGKIDYIGKTVCGYDIPVIRKGNGNPRTLIVGTVHAREFVTGYLLLDLIKEYSGRGGIDVIPILDIDGAVIAEDGLPALNADDNIKRNLIKINGGSSDFRLWKANARGVDLNVNFDAEWGRGRGNVFYPAPQGYVGKYPLSEPETKAVSRLMSDGDYALVVAYHSKGEEVYWGFGDNLLYKEEASEIAKKLGYTLKTTPWSTGGLKDEFVLKTGRLGLTIEVGEDKFPHPYPEEEYGNLLKKHDGIFNLYTEIARKLWTKYTT